MADNFDQTFQSAQPTESFDKVYENAQNEPIPALASAPTQPQAQVPAQTVPPQQVQQVTGDASHVNVFDPETQEVGSIPKAQLQDALDQGYQVASHEQVQHHFLQKQYGTTGQEILTALEGAGEGASFGLSTGLERMMGVDPKAIRARREINPTAHMIGQGAGLVGSAFIPGVGEANILSKVGVGGAKALGLGLEGAGLASKIGSGAVKAAVENMMFQGGDEVSKMLSGDPNQSVETALTDIGLAGTIGAGIGGGVGVISPLWKATYGQSVGKLLNAIQERAGGIEGEVPTVADAVKANLHDTMRAAGIEVPAEVKAALADNPEVRQMFQTLQESPTGSGLEAQKALRTFKNNTGDAIVTSLGKTPEEVANLAHMSEYDMGQSMKETLADGIKKIVDPISEKFNKVREMFKSETLSDATKSDIATKVSDMSSAEGYNLSPSSSQAGEVQRVLKELPNLKTLEDLRKYQSVIADNTSSPELYRVGSQLKKILREAETDQVTQRLGEKAPELLGDHAAARSAYKDAMDIIDELNDRLHVGKYSGPDSFVKALKEMAPEDVARRLGVKNDADLLKSLAQKFPEVAKQIREYHISNALKAAAAKAGPEATINSKVFFGALDKMSPELREFVMSPEVANKLGAIRQLMDALPEKMNTSGTAKTLDALWNKIPASAIGMATMAMGHNPLMGFLLGGLTKFLGRDAPDAARLAFLKYLGSSQPIESEGFKAMFDFIHHTIQGENLIGKTVGNVFKAGQEVLPQRYLPSEKAKKDLDARLKDLQTDQASLLDLGGKTGHYLPEHGTAVAQVTMNAVNYLNSQRPQVQKKNILDSEPKLSPAQKTQYDRVLTIAQQPLSILNHVKEGTVTPQDVAALQHMYPSLYQKLSGQLMNGLTEKVQKGESIPYRSRLGLSMFLGQPLDSTMTPEAIQATQPQDQPGPQPPAPTLKRGTAPLTKMSGMYATSDQQREMRKNK